MNGHRRWTTNMDMPIKGAEPSPSAADIDRKRRRPKSAALRCHHTVTWVPVEPGANQLSVNAYVPSPDPLSLATDSREQRLESVGDERIVEVSGRPCCY
jgi:hypothetical protein